MEEMPRAGKSPNRNEVVIYEEILAEPHMEKFNSAIEGLTESMKYLEKAITILDEVPNTMRRHDGSPDNPDTRSKKLISALQLLKDVYEIEKQCLDVNKEVLENKKEKK